MKEREEKLIQQEEHLHQREKFEIEENERRRKEMEEEKFDMAALLARVKLQKGKGGFSMKKHYGTVAKIDSNKKTLQHRHSFNAMQPSKKNSIVPAINERRHTM